MKVLFLDDMPVRFQKFEAIFKDECNEILHAETSKDAIGLLQNNKFDAIFLDHDLGGTYFVPSGEDTGFEVAEWICENVDYKPIIIIHSMNPMGGVNMHHKLQDHGFNPILCPFNCLLGIYQ